MGILALDVGTSACKATLARENLDIIDSCSVPYPTRFAHPSWAEQDPGDWWTGVAKAVNRLLTLNPGMAAQVDVIGLSGHMTGLVTLDSSGNPLRPAFIHADMRAGEELRLLDREVGGQVLYGRSGTVLNATTSLCKALWVRRNQPELYHRTARFLQSKDYLVWRLTGNMDSSDFSDASHGLLIDVHKKAYLDDVFAQVGLDADKFPTLHPSTEIVGRLQEGAAAQLGLPAGIPVAAGGGDGPCAGAGAGVAETGKTYCCLGTSMWISYHQPAPVVDVPPRVFSIMFLDGEGFGTYGSSQSGGRVVNWVQQLFGLRSPKELDALALKAPPGCDGLLLLPYLEGERSPVFDERARGNFFGITPAHTREHFCRAALEGPAFALRDILTVLREKGSIPEMRIIGGGSKSAAWKQIIADACDVVVADVTSTADSATSLGAAISAGVGVGIFPSIQAAAAGITVCGRTYPNRERAALYGEAFPRYRQLYRQLAPLFHA